MRTIDKGVRFYVYLQAANDPGKWACPMKQIGLQQDPDILKAGQIQTRFNHESDKRVAYNFQSINNCDKSD